MSAPYYTRVPITHRSVLQIYAKSHYENSETPRFLELQIVQLTHSAKCMLLTLGSLDCLLASQLA